MIRCNRCGADNDDPIIAGLIKQNEDLMKIVQGLIDSRIQLTFRVDGRHLLSDAAIPDMEKLLSRTAAIAAQHKIEDLLTSRRELYQEMDRLKFGLSRYVYTGQGPSV